MTNKFFSSVDGNHSRVASDLPSRCSRLASLSIVSRQSVLGLLLLILTLFMGVGNVWGLTKEKEWTLTSSSSDFTQSDCVTYFSQPYGMKKANAYIQTQNIQNFKDYASLATKIEVSVKCLQNGGTTSRLTVYLLDKDGNSLGSQVITPVNASAASSTTYQTATFSSNLSGATGFKVQCTTFGKNILINGAKYVLTYNNASYDVNWTIDPAAGGTLSTTSGTSTTVTPNSEYMYGSPAYTVTSGSASVLQSTNTFSATPSANCTIRINMVEKPKYTVTLKDDNDTRTQASYGAAVSLPLREGCTGYTFAGWTKTWTSAQSSWTTTAPTIIPAGSYTPTSDINLYPVYTKTEGSAAAWNKVTTLDGITAGTYVIVSDGCALQNTAASSSPARDATNYGVTISNNQITSTVSDAMKWSFTVNNSVVTIKSFANSNNYLYNGTNGNTGVRVGTTSDTWTFEENTSAPAFAMYDATKSRYCCSTVSTYNDWRSYTSADADNYRDGGKIYLFKQSGGSTTYYISEPNCCTPLVSINGSFNRYHLKIFHHIIMSMFVSLIFKC